MFKLAEVLGMPGGGYLATFPFILPACVGAAFHLALIPFLMRFLPPELNHSRTRTRPRSNPVSREHAHAAAESRSERRERTLPGNDWSILKGLPMLDDRGVPPQLENREEAVAQ